MTPDLFASTDHPGEIVGFEPTRADGLHRLSQFAARTGTHYARQRNFDFGADKRSNVSALSPWIRHRLVTEEDVLTETLARHTPASAEKFIQEVFWRTYFKGWLEQHPSVWHSYRSGLSRALDAGMGDCQAAMDGRTGIACFDHWAHELVETGYLHNHARMWFASIWIFTLRLPWEVGADFFLRHLIDGDPASNTLSWRWVGGLHTKGKTYLARPSNIEKYTSGRFNPQRQLSETAEPLTEAQDHPRVQIRTASPPPTGDYLLLVTEEDCMIERVLPHPPAARLGLLATQDRSSLPIGQRAEAFAKGAVGSVAETISHPKDLQDHIVTSAQAAGVKTIVTAYAPVGPVAEVLAQLDLNEAGLTLHRVRRDYDTVAWPFATRGFFGLKKKIPAILGELGYGI